MSDAETRLAKAQTFITAGKLQEAEQAYRAILADLPEQPEALRMLGYIHLQRGHFDAAETALQESASLDPNTPETWSYLGDVYASKRQSRKAIEACSKAVKAAPQDAQPRHHLAVMLHRFRFLDRAKKAAEATLALEEDMPGAQRLYAAILFDLGEFKEAAQRLASDAMEDRPLPEPNAWYARSLAVLGEKQTLEELKPARDLKQRHYEFVVKAAVAFQDDRIDEASDFLNRAQAVSKRTETMDRARKRQKVLEGMLANRNLRPELYEPRVEAAIPVIGDNFALCASGLLVSVEGAPRRLQAYSMMTGRFRRLGAPAFPAADKELEIALRNAPESDEVIFGFTEFNFRRDRKVLPAIRIQGDDRALEQLTTYVERAVTTIVEKASAQGRKAAICNLPHQIMVEGLARDDRDFLDRATRHINAEISRLAQSEGLRVVDLFAATSKSDGSPDRSLYFFEDFPRPTVLAKALAKAYT